LNSKYVKTAYSQRVDSSSINFGGSQKQLWLEGSSEDMESVFIKHHQLKINMHMLSSDKDKDAK
jgi:hypothetical protein